MQVCVFEFMNKSLFFPSDMWSSQHSHYKAQKGNCLCECSSRKVLNKNQSYLPFTNMTEYKAFKMCSPERYKAILILINLMLIGKHTDEGCCLCFFFVYLFGFLFLGMGGNCLSVKVTTHRCSRAQLSHCHVQVANLRSSEVFDMVPSPAGSSLQKICTLWS